MKRTAFATARAMSAVAAVTAVIAVFVASVRASQSEPTDSLREPVQDTLFVSRHCVTRLVVEPDGAIAAQTAGGALRRGAEGWQEAVSAPSSSPVFWRGKAVTIDRTGSLRVGDLPLPFPPDSTGTHVTAVAREGDSLICSLYGDDALYRWAGTDEKKPPTWTRLPTGLPPDVGSQITALAETDQVVCVGTRRRGIWERSRQPPGDWHPVGLAQSGPCDDDAQSMVVYNGCLFVSTLEDGLAIYDGAAWIHAASPTLSGDAPRQMVAFGGALYVRQGSGRVDRLVGSVWTRDVWAGQLPRKEVSALATDSATLYAAQWGGWSAWNGVRWTHHLTEPGLQGVALTALLPDGPTLWVGTQGHGLAEADARTGAIRRWHDARRGMPDDWITCLTRDGDAVYAGTFVGGVACRRDGDDRWTVAPGTSGENITDFAHLGSEVIVAATRHGLRTVGQSTMTLPARLTQWTLEGQALCTSSASGLWVGTRQGIYYVPLPQVSGLQQDDTKTGRR